MAAYEHWLSEPGTELSRLLGRTIEQVGAGLGTVRTAPPPPRDAAC